MAADPRDPPAYHSYNPAALDYAALSAAASPRDALAVLRKALYPQLIEVGVSDRIISPDVLIELLFRQRAELRRNLHGNEPRELAGTAELASCIIPQSITPRVADTLEYLLALQEPVFSKFFEQPR